MKNLSILLLVFLLISCEKEQDNTAERFFLIGKDFFKQNQLDKAKRSFLKAIEEKDDIINAHFMLAKIYSYKNDNLNALKHLNIVIEKNKFHRDSLYWRAKILALKKAKTPEESKENYKQAINDLKDLLEMDYHHIPARNLLAILYEKNKMYKQAIYEYLKALQEEKNLTNTRANLTLLYLKLGLKEKSLRQIERAISIAEISKIKTKNLEDIKKGIEK